MSPDISKVKNMLREEKIWNAVKMHMDNYHRAQVLQSVRYISALESMGLPSHCCLPKQPPPMQLESKNVLKNLHSGSQVTVQEQEGRTFLKASLKGPKKCHL
jgi:hypothetical protein